MEVYKSKDKRFTLERNRNSVTYSRDGEVVAEYSLDTEERAVKKFNQLKRLMIQVN